jgi:hypothetical protein
VPSEEAIHFGVDRHCLGLGYNESSLEPMVIFSIGMDVLTLWLILSFKGVMEVLTNTYVVGFIWYKIVL